MRLASWIKPRPAQLDLLATPTAPDAAAAIEETRAATAPPARHGEPVMLPVVALHEDPNNPRTEFPDAEIEELADDIRRHGILQPLVVHPADAQGHYRIHFGAKRWRAAQRAGLTEVPVVVRDAPADSYTQVAENQRRHGLTPLDLARFIKGRVGKGDSNAVIAKRLGMNLTTVAHHLSLLDLPPELDQALKTGRCTSPRTLHELSKLHEAEPDKVRALVDSHAEITRAAVATMKVGRSDTATKPTAPPSPDAIDRANAACDRLERVLAQIERSPDFAVASPELVALRIRLQALATTWLQGSDRQTPSTDTR